MISFLELISFISSLAALILLLSKWEKRLYSPQNVCLATLLVINCLISLASHIEWLYFKNTSAYQIQTITDYLQILQPIFWGLFYYLCVVNQQREQIKEGYTRLQKIVENMPVILVAQNKNHSLASWNHQAERISGYTKEDINNNGLFPQIFKRRPSTLSKNHPLRDDVYNRNIIELTDKDGRVRHIAWHDISNTYRIPGWDTWGVGFDISNEIRIQDELRHSATHDNLTGLPNRAVLLEHINQCINDAKKDSASSALLLIDIDNFKFINDTMGHSTGDLLLIQLGGILRKSIKNTDLVSRFGGDEFCILLKKVISINEIENIVKCIFLAIEMPIELSGSVTTTTTLSMGIALCSENLASAEELIQNADLAMYSAKANGRNRYHFFSNEMKDKLKRKQRLSEMLRQAIKRHELYVVYHPQVDVLKNKVIGAEALLRWKPKGQKNIPPAEFIPIAEHFGLINELTAWVTEKTCTDFSHWDGFDNIASVAINLSAKQFYDKHLIKDFLNIINHSGIAKEKIEFEITESILINDIERAIGIMQNLRSAGFKLSLDDFGTGYSSLAYLKKFPINKIKFDRAFITNLHHDRTNQAIVKNIINLSHNLNMTTIAEGVEQEEEMLYLAKLNCDYIQGYYYSKPLLFDDFVLWVENYSADPTPKHITT